MVGPSLNSPKPPASTTTTIKFLCSYGGRILPRYPDGKLRYHGGHTRVLAVARSISFSELMAKLAELCGKTASLRCQLPTEDLDALVTITSDEELENLLEEYDSTTQSQSHHIKIRAFLSLTKKCSSPSLTRTPSSASASGSGSSTSSTDSSPTPKSPSPSLSGFYTAEKMNSVIYTSSKPPVCQNKAAAGGHGKMPCYGYRNNGYNNRFCVVPNGNYWQ
uniref:uncharacterized protein LOC122596091 n=1 Tax=Erigeron canadensis TaxID=72917 RepID=UPI001CB9432F|nr:uncharacterized protein LOC122596091 [Erigeron canadensis]XP_043624545.1 uncharacterized protein LOC122596091 [Erigeron canadensis]